jgi:hypothetical protein
MPPHPSPTYERLRLTIAERMRMSPIDQPLMLTELLGARNSAPPQDINRRILGEDVTQIENTRERLTKMVGRGTRQLPRHRGTPLSCLQASQRRNVSTSAS